MDAAPFRLTMAVRIVQCEGSFNPGTVVEGTVMGVPPPDELGAPAFDGLLPTPVVVLSRTSRVPLLEVVTNPAILGFVIFQVLNLIGISASASSPLAVRSIETLNVTG